MQPLICCNPSISPNPSCNNISIVSSEVHFHPITRFLWPRSLLEWISVMSFRLNNLLMISQNERVSSCDMETSWMKEDENEMETSQQVNEDQMITSTDEAVRGWSGRLHAVQWSVSPFIHWFIKRDEHLKSFVLFAFSRSWSHRRGSRLTLLAALLGWGCSCEGISIRLD